MEYSVLLKRMSQLYIDDKEKALTLVLSEKSKV